MQVMTREEARTAGMRSYTTGLPCKHGHRSDRSVASGSCLECKNLSEKRRRAEFSAEEREEYIRFHRQYYQDNKEAKTTVNASWRQRNPDKVKSYLRKSEHKHRDKKRARTAARRRRYRTATPAWVDKKAIRQIYLNCPPGYHVDHEIPIKGKLVCGLHVPWNLKAVPARDNLIKHNKFDPETYVHIFPPAEDYELPLAA